jgi:Na+-transporting methylmalonyl-CoA/oxaloacetate decarboxylase gamma subunit
MASWWSQVSATAVQGLQITIVGMALVFFTLGLIIVSMVLLTRLPGLRAGKADEEPEEAPEKTAADVVDIQPVAAGGELAEIAAIAVALIRSKGRGRPSTKPTVAANAWKQAGRARQLGL